MPSLGDRPTKCPAWSSRRDGTTERWSCASRHSSCTETELTAHRGEYWPESAKERPTEAEPESQWCPRGSVPSQESEACHHRVSPASWPPRNVLVSRRASSRNEVSAPEAKARDRRRPAWSAR